MPNKKGKFRHVGLELWLYCYFNLGASGGGWLTPRRSRFRFTLMNVPVPIVQEAGRDPGRGWTGEKNLAATRIRSRDRPTLCKSLYRLSGPSRRCIIITDKFSIII